MREDDPMGVETARIEDLSAIVASAREFWGERTPPFHHPLLVREFGDGALVVRDDNGRRIAAYLFGLILPSRSLAYVHVVAVREDARRRGLAAALYDAFEARARSQGCSELKAITTPANAASVAFHLSRGMRAHPIGDYAGPGEPRVVLSKRLETGARGWSATHLDDVEAVQWRGSELVWRPVRRELGVRIVGIAAYTAERAGQELVEAHRESSDGRGHEEVYLVLRGAARFTLDGEPLAASAGTFLRVAPDVHRHAVATEPGSAVVALGGPSVFMPSASEWIERARPLFASDPTRAAEIVDELRSSGVEPGGIIVAEALLALGRGDRRRAVALIDDLIACHPDHPGLRDTLRADPDLGPLLENY
jgi:GNAT superfamily N-acetyltransferase